MGGRPKLNGTFFQVKKRFCAFYPTKWHCLGRFLSPNIFLSPGYCMVLPHPHCGFLHSAYNIDPYTHTILAQQGVAEVLFCVDFMMLVTNHGPSKATGNCWKDSFLLWKVVKKMVSYKNSFLQESPSHSNMFSSIFPSFTSGYLRSEVPLRISCHETSTVTPRY